MREELSRLCSLIDGFVEVRHHKKKSRTIAVRKSEITDLSIKRTEGTAIRVLIQGVWGFAASSLSDRGSLERALKQAETMARSLASRKKHKASLALAQLARGEFELDGYQELNDMLLEEKLATVSQSESRIRAEKGIESAHCQYAEIFEEKIIITSDGANCVIKTVRPEFRFSAFAESGGHVSSGFDSVGVSGGWQCLFQDRPLDSFIETASKNAIDLLDAPRPEGGTHTVILSPAMVGLLSHEAIGHTVEADFVKSGSVAQGMMGQMVASELVTLCDSGKSEIRDHAGGMIPVDDEGVFAGKTTIIDRGKLVSYLHNRESAAEFGVTPTGNARAWEFSDEPLIRMRNTYVAPGEDRLEDMISGIDSGYYIEGPEGGQADATGEFMFGASRVRAIRGGNLAESVQKVTVSGNAFDVLRSVDAVSSDFRWDLGSGHCGKGQPAKVDAGGPYIRCKILIGGAQ
ncbi:MAG: TldD/PmbA family protein [Spirochaetia bacterium]|nr:TldD/PmbA family protein [Spirochaetia bacterium]